DEITAFRIGQRPARDGDLEGGRRDFLAAPAVVLLVIEETLVTEPRADEFVASVDDGDDGRGGIVRERRVRPRHIDVLAVPRISLTQLDGDRRAAHLVPAFALPRFEDRDDPLLYVGPERRRLRDLLVGEKMVGPRLVRLILDLANLQKLLAAQAKGV